MIRQAASPTTDRDAAEEQEEEEEEGAGRVPKSFA